MKFRSTRQAAQTHLDGSKLIVQLDALDEAFCWARNLVEAMELMALGLESVGIEEGSTFFTMTQCLSDQVKAIGNGLGALRGSSLSVPTSAKRPRRR